jgi:hypothetical protein
MEFNNLSVQEKSQMPKLTFSYNDDTTNTVIEVLEDNLKVKDSKLKITCLKSFDDEDYYEFDVNEDEYTINNLKFENKDDNCWEVKFEASIEIEDSKWQNADSNFKKNAEDGMIEVEFDLEVDGELYEENDHFEKQSDGQTELFID